MSTEAEAEVFRSLTNPKTPLSAPFRRCILHPVSDSTAPIVPTTSVPPRRKLTMQDVEAVAKLVANRLTETEACLQLDINPQQWFMFKQRSKRSDKFEYVVSRVKGAKIQACMQTLEVAGHAVNSKTGIPEWRAHDRYLDRLDPQRFEKQSAQINVNLIAGVPNNIVEAAREAFLARSKPLPVAVSAPVPDTTRAVENNPPVDVPTEVVQDKQPTD